MKIISVNKNRIQNFRKVCENGKQHTIKPARFTHFLCMKNILCAFYLSEYLLTLPYIKLLIVS
ncbi:hypothetical protein BACCOPRO_01304 [Phocaeicola coprophilus DSM 18228 = JCM 13818]|uniref:Uncharacterized protein n=1 Tax=Phocaeicola coprophilus DSM 18228 = JCM 13818 TaxID=547042 RepID=S0F7R6_9BACT|nr:hypothetical protein BACCOPRO_01304 [Phocaeicola coprophilus DSM 18228 = JCM 13818]